VIGPSRAPLHGGRTGAQCGSHHDDPDDTARKPGRVV